ncbi:LANO_0B04060g1_1 [Lachancea nothofagi CBS 11611]|uniref:LANO_0B04060g1_1 n=1 Tax=Lachancea nothofagi CBS 11611 TaxID=1266666 RepID=A0A1G4IXN6_9SACH|nr:LANO_0B04060g1_1 [Lachancea nothofagi CBS 11611]
MGFFNDNSIIMTIQRIFRRPSDAAMWLFTGMIVVGTFYTMLGMGPKSKKARR